jgi:hypothetical protein
LESVLFQKAVAPLWQPEKYSVIRSRIVSDFLSIIERVTTPRPVGKLFLKNRPDVSDNGIPVDSLGGFIANGAVVDIHRRSFINLFIYVS